MADRSILIIGAGIAGLATGCYAQMNGYHTKIVEMHSLPGGVCTAWQRKGYTLDGCIHHLAGCRPGTGLYRMWQELGAMPRDLIYPEQVVRIEAPGGKALIIHADLDRLADHLNQLAPADARAIDRYLRAARACRRFDMMELAVAGPREMARALPVILSGLRWLGKTMASAADCFSDPFLRRAFPFILYDEPENPLPLHLNLLAQCETHGFGLPRGGSLQFAKDIEKRYRALGGEVHYRARVDKVLVEGGAGGSPKGRGRRRQPDDRAVGVRLVDGSEHRAGVIVSTAYPRTTLYDLLGGRYTGERVRAAYSTPRDEVAMGLQVSLGVARDLSGEPPAIVLLLPQPIEIAGRRYDRLSLELFGFDPSLAPPGKGVLKVMFKTSYAYWREVHRDPARYRAEKERVAATVLDQLEQRFPGLGEQVEVVDVATPLTIERYTGNGPAFQGSLGLPLAGFLAGRGIVRTLPGLANFYMVGQWAGLPGLPWVAGMGRNLVRHLCRRDRSPFVTTITAGGGL
ncbi:MAG: NAD(P)/FAD-dependent oxidoreductase [Anaerolineae bacterium]|jgi:phytoene dehydrogenase-like protein